MRKQPEGDALNGNLTAMIDVVFQLIIFFVCTAKIQEGSIDDRIQLARAPSGEAQKVIEKDTVFIDVSNLGTVYIGHEPFSLAELQGMLKSAVSQSSAGQNIPIVIRGDSRTEHKAISDVLLACGAAGVWKVQFAALREKGTNPK